MKNNSGLIKFYKGEKCNRNQKEDEISINFNWRFDEVFFYVEVAKYVTIFRPRKRY